MPEILTESFCERCGTRYTFEAAAPRGKRLGKLKTFSKGFVNFVTNDETSLDEAFAEARSEEQRELTNQQLDAFHQTFQFCMSCRQYTCASCWNEVESRCLSCAPMTLGGALGTSLPAVDPLARIGFGGTNGAFDGGSNGNGEHAATEGPSVWPTADLPSNGEPSADIDLETRLGLRAITAGAAAEQAGGTEPPGPADAVEDGSAPVIEPDASTMLGMPVQPDQASEGIPVDEDVAMAVAAERERQAAEAAAMAERERQAAEAAEAERVHQAEAEQAERERQAAEAEGVRQALEQAEQAERERQAAEQERWEAAERERQAAAEAERVRQAQAEQAERERQAAEAERARRIAEDTERARQAAALAAAMSATTPAPEAPAATSTDADRAAAAAAQTTDLLNRFRPSTGGGPATEPTTGAPSAVPAGRDDVVGTPTWQIVAPEAAAPPPPPAIASPHSPPTAPTPTQTGAAAAGGGTPAPTNGGSAPTGAGRDWPSPATTPPPQWPMPVAPAAPQWPTSPLPPAGTDVWAASSQELIARPGTGVQACLSCGLPLSASARFCRRCGTQQH
jgi:chemotaxis protein histidine kinase CheA/ribosomal protein L40E